MSQQCDACKREIDLKNDPLNMLIEKGPDGSVTRYEHLQCPDNPPAKD